VRYHLKFRDLNETTKNATRFHREVFKLRKHLADFNPDLVELWGTIATLPRNSGFTAHVRVHLPTGTLTSEGRGYTRFAAWNDAVKELESRLERHKSRLCRSQHRRKHRRDDQRWDDLGNEPVPNGHAVRSSIQAGFPELLEFIRTEIRMHEKKGNLPRGHVDPVELADAVAMIVLKEVDNKPADLSYEHWFFKVAYEQVLEAIDEARREREGRGKPPAIDTILPRPEGPEGVTDEEELVNEWYEPGPRPRFGHDIPDPRPVDEPE
jgi:ribosome-associated translation inhibitor RaiA